MDLHSIMVCGAVLSIFLIHENKTGFKSHINRTPDLFILYSNITTEIWHSEWMKVLFLFSTVTIVNEKKIE